MKILNPEELKPHRLELQKAQELSGGETTLINHQQVGLWWPAVTEKPLKILREEPWRIRARQIHSANVC